ncbi:MAG: dUTP diphosphatase [Clostridia bacterium]|nr:dUTP diphosphatase [Clostridia bacterium]
MKIKYKCLRDSAAPPFRATSGSAGADLCAATDAPVTIRPHTAEHIPTGLAIELPSDDCAAFVFARSGLSRKHGIAPVNCVGVIDSDYRGEIIVALVNQFDEPYTVMPGERVAQLVVMPVINAEFEKADELSDTERGAGGFGSTGK